MREQIVILDFGSQYTQVIARRIRECKVYSTILKYDTPVAEIAALQPRAIILSGGPQSVYFRKAPLPDRQIFELGVPILVLSGREAITNADSVFRTRISASRQGIRLARYAVKEMKRLGILIDLSHVGDRTTLETAELSEQPVACTHANARAFAGAGGGGSFLEL